MWWLLLTVNLTRLRFTYKMVKCTSGCAMGQFQRGLTHGTDGMLARMWQHHPIRWRPRQENVQVPFSLSGCIDSIHVCRWQALASSLFQHERNASCLPGSFQVLNVRMGLPRLCTPSLEQLWFLCLFMNIDSPHIQITTSELNQPTNYILLYVCVH